MAESDVLARGCERAYQAGRPPLQRSRSCVVCAALERAKVLEREIDRKERVIESDYLDKGELCTFVIP